MKTTNKIQKTVFTAALAVGFSIIGLSIDAQVESSPLPTNNPTNNLAMVNLNSSNHLSTAMFNEVNPTTGSEIANYLITETDAPLTIEKWMLDDSNFSSVNSIESEIETPLQIEAWMMDKNIFDATSMVIEAATDEQLNFEDWMLDEHKFEVKSNQDNQNNSKPSVGYIFINNISFPAVVVENELQIEDWMTNSKIWK
jgi:hypothetical protein